MYNYWRCNVGSVVTCTSRPTAWINTSDINSRFEITQAMGHWRFLANRDVRDMTECFIYVMSFQCNSKLSFDRWSIPSIRGRNYIVTDESLMKFITSDKYIEESRMKCTVILECSWLRVKNKIMCYFEMVATIPSTNHRKVAFLVEKIMQLKSVKEPT